MPNLHWILQRNITKREVLTQIESALEMDGIKFQEVDVIPFSDQLPRIDQTSNQFIFYGSSTLMLNAYRSEYANGIFYNHSFTIENYLDRWGRRMLNSDALITTLAEFANLSLYPYTEWFVRPNADNKAFSGTLMTFEDIKQFAQDIESTNNPHLLPETLIAFSAPKEIAKEWRSFIVNGKPVSTTRYLQDGRLNISVSDVPDDLNQFIEESCEVFTPHEIFVMDIALYHDKYYIVECNCFNGSGFYEHDIVGIVRAVNHFFTKSSDDA